MKKQKEIFLESEGDAWIQRNHAVVSATKFDTEEPVLKAASMVLESKLVEKPVKVLEIGCGEGGRLLWMASHWGAEVYGLDPSQQAVDMARKNGVQAFKGTADKLPFDESMFDMVIFGFCLYLCDRDDLTAIANEADRVLKESSWVIIHDFFSMAPVKRPYHHYEGLFSYKMDYRTLFENKPGYSCYYHMVQGHEGNGMTDKVNDWVATSLLRKHSSIVA